MATKATPPRTHPASPDDERHRGKIVQGCMAIHKPLGISSAQVLRDMQRHFNPSRLFAPALAAERALRGRESAQERKRRSKAKSGPPAVKIGHGGTLDPQATGVLIAGIGAGTKALPTFLGCTKTYECVALFGAATDTYDAAGKVVGTKPYAHLTRGKVEAALVQFRGKIMQKPPIYSALHLNGKRLYEYAREGLELPIEISSRPVEVLNLDLIEWLEPGSHGYRWPEQVAEQEDKAIAQKLMRLSNSISLPSEPAGLPDEHTLDIESDDKRVLSLKRSRDDDSDGAVQDTPENKRQRDGEPDAPKMRGALAPVIVPSKIQASPPSDVVRPPAAKFRMTVTSGFYVRSFCHDLGRALDTLAHMSALVRSRQADFELGKNVFEYSELEKGEDVWGPQIEAMLDEWNNKSLSA